MVAIVCDCHAHLVENKKWYATWSKNTQSFYAARNRSSLLGHGLIYLHAIINGTPKEMQTDHINGDTLDNRCDNLRTVTVSENNRNSRKRRDNSSGFKGVDWHKRCHRWRAQITVGGKTKHLGLFDTAEEAAHAYDAAARELYREFAKTNFK